MNALMAVALGSFAAPTLLAQVPAGWQGSITVVQSSDWTNSQSRQVPNSHLTPDVTFQVGVSDAEEGKHTTTLEVKLQLSPSSGENPQPASISTTFETETIGVRTEVIKARCTQDGPVVTATVVTTNTTSGSASATVQGTVSVSETGFSFSSPPMEAATTVSGSVTGAGVCGRRHEPGSMPSTLPVEVQQFGLSDLQLDPENPDVLSGSRTETAGVMTTTYTWNLSRKSCGKPRKLPPKLTAVRDALVQGMQDAGFDASARHISVEAGGVTRFGVRIAEGGCVLPTIEAVKNSCPAPGSQKGAERLLVGGVQHTAQGTRVTARLVESETGVVIRAAKADAEGNGDEATAQAMADVLGQLELAADCAE